MNTTSSKPPDTLGNNVLSVALIGPAEARRRALAGALASLQGSVTREFSNYPDLDDVPRLLESEYDVVIVELDSNPEYALELIENICSKGSVTVMVYSDNVVPDMLMRCMRAGAREFLSQPITSTSIAEAMVRASVRRPTARVAKKAMGKMLVFVGAKGGSGVTTIASNFAVALAQDSGKNVALIDLNLPFGNAALDLGITSQYSSATALLNPNRLDSNYLSSLLVKHNSGLSILAAPDKYVSVHPTEESIERLVHVTRQDFDYIVVDAGSRFDSASKSLFEAGSTVYLVLQVGISDLRNANRLISEIFRVNGVKLEIVLNRYASRALSIDEASINKALTMPAAWKVPGDFAAVRASQNAATPLVAEDNAVSRVIKQMARAAYGATEPQEKKKKFSLFG
ncbi:MAG TPA: AAA family ATPase [Acidobacteriaceae bacterium]